MQDGYATEREPGGWQHESILADPFGQIVKTVTRALPDATGAGAVAVQIAPENPSRMALFAQVVSLDPLFLSPFPAAPTALPLAGADTRVPVLIHLSAYPGLTQGSWWACTTAGTTIKVWETVLQR